MTNIIEKRDTNPASTPLDGSELVYLGQSGVDAVALVSDISDYVVAQITTSYVTFTSTNPANQAFVTDSELVTDVEVTIDDSTPRAGFLVFLAQSNDWADSFGVRIRVVSDADISDFHIQDQTETDLTLSVIPLLTAPVDVTFFYQKRGGTTQLIARSGV